MNGIKQQIEELQKTISKSSRKKRIPDDVRDDLQYTLNNLKLEYKKLEELNKTKVGEGESPSGQFLCDYPMFIEYKNK